jgi:hydrogenase/urease accessory protein HupE
MRKKARALAVIFPAFGVWLFTPSWLEAHDPGLSFVDLRVEDARVLATLTCAYPDIGAIYPMDRDLDGKISPSEVELFRPRVEALTRAALELTQDGEVLSPSEVAVQWEEETRAFFLSIVFPRSPGRKLHLRSAILERLPRGHRQLISVKDANGKALLERVLDVRNDSLEVDLGEAAPPAGPATALEFLKLGVEHIFTGYDHLAFLFALLITGGTLLAAARIITSFTVAHSLTLAIATLGLVQISPRVVEPLIAVSIVYVGLENVLRKELKRRWLLTFAFGLIHGFGFASVLRELGIGSSAGSVATPLLCFNLGVEAGQLTIAALVLPAILRLRKYPSFATRFAPVFSVLVSCLGGYWLVQRIL